MNLVKVQCKTYHLGLPVLRWRQLQHRCHVNFTNQSVSCLILAASAGYQNDIELMFELLVMLR